MDFEGYHLFHYAKHNSHPGYIRIFRVQSIENRKIVPKLVCKNHGIQICIVNRKFTNNVNKKNFAVLNELF